MSQTPNAWRCFHCDEVFTSSETAAEHFGPRIYSDPACTINAARLRELEAELARYREEDTDLHREIHGMQAEHHTALRREEEKGYTTGLRDGTQAFEQAMKQTWQMIDPIRPPPAGTYAMGEHNGIAAALRTVRDNFNRALGVAIPQPGQEKNHG